MAVFTICTCMIDCPVKSLEVIRGDYKIVDFIKLFLRKEIDF